MLFTAVAFPLPLPPPRCPISQMTAQGSHNLGQDCNKSGRAMNLPWRRPQKMGLPSLSGMSADSLYNKRLDERLEAMHDTETYTHTNTGGSRACCGMLISRPK